MYDLALNRLTHDMVFHKTGEGDKVELWMIEGADRVAQQIKMTLLAFLGEWFLDITFGVPYLEEILVKNPRISSVHSILRAKIYNVPDVVRIDNLTIEFDRMRRILYVDFLVHTNMDTIKQSLQLEVLSVRRSYN